MFSNLNPLDRPTAILEIVIMLLGAAIIGFLLAWILRKPKKNSAESVVQNGTNAVPDKRMAQLEKALDGLKAEKSLLEKELQSIKIKAQEKEFAIRKELEIANSNKVAQPNNQALENSRKQVAELERAIEKLKSKLRETEEKLVANHHILQKAGTETQTLLETENTSLKVELAAANSKISDAISLQNALDILQTKFNAASSLDDFEALKKENATLQTQLTGASSEDGAALNALKIENALLIANARTAESQVAEVLALKEELNALKQNSSTFPIVKTADSEEIVRLQSEILTLKANAEKASQDSTSGQSLSQIAELEQLRTEIAQLKKQTIEVLPESDRIRTLEKQLRDQQREVFNLQADLAKLRNEKAANTAPTTGAGGNKELDWLKKEKEDLEIDVKDLESQIDRLEKENSELRTLARDKSAAGPALDKLTKERDRLKMELEKMKKTGNETLPPINADFTHLGLATIADKNELTTIIGIGPVVEGKLNQLGIYTFKQVSRLTPADMDTIDQILQLFPGRVKRENWLEQAAKLVADSTK